MRTIKHPPKEESLIQYPCHFPIKIIGKQYPDFCNEIVRLVQKYDPDFDAQHVELRGSKNGNYVGITVTVWATSRAQLDSLYSALCHHPMVKVAL